MAHVEGKLCPKNFTISKEALKKTEDILAFTVERWKLFFLSLTLVLPSQQSLICLDYFPTLI